MKKFYKVGLLTSILLSGCDESKSDDISCPTVTTPAITISVIDQKTSNSVSCGVTILIEDTNYSEELTNPQSQTCDDNLVLSGALDREGIYNVHVYKEGYLDWSQYNIVVTTGTCSVRTIHIEALLEK